MNEITIKEQLLSMTLSELNRLIEIIRTRKDIVSVEVLTEVDLLEMKAEDEAHFRGFVRQLREDIANEPA
jgi:hypothetical protein